MISAVLIDDEPKALQSLRWELETFCPQVKIENLFQNPREAVAYLNSNNTANCLFLDIEMPGMDGFQLLDNLESRHFAVIITTAYDQYGINAIKERALDYLLKPIDSEDLQKAIARVEDFLENDLLKDRFEETLLKLVANIPSTQRQISINSDGKILFLRPDVIV